MMRFKGNLIWDGKVLEPSEYPNFYIQSKVIDRIVNEIYEKSVNGQKEAKEKTDCCRFRKPISEKLKLLCGISEIKNFLCEEKRKLIYCRK